MSTMTFDDSKARLEEIASQVEDENISLDEALALFEEAVTLGLHACEVSEQDIQLDSPEPSPEPDMDELSGALPSETSELSQEDETSR